MNLATGSAGESLPASISIIAATLVIGFVIECSAKIVSGVILDTETFQIDRLAVLLDQDDRARQLSRRNFIVEKLGDALELVR